MSNPSDSAPRVVLGDQIVQHGSNNIGKVEVNAQIEDVQRLARQLLGDISRFVTEDMGGEEPDEIAEITGVLVEQSESSRRVPGLSLALGALRNVLTSTTGSALAPTMLAAVEAMRKASGI